MIRFYLFFGLLSFFNSHNLHACSRVFFNQHPGFMVAGRNMDWIDAMPVDLYALPRGAKRSGLTGKNTLEWISKYGSVVTGSSVGSPDGMNEKGLAGHMLWLSASNYGKFNPEGSSLSVGAWLQFYLDNFATVAELVEYTQTRPFQVVTGIYDGLEATVHLAFEDKTGDSAVIEIQKGKPVIYHGKQYTVMTNDPTYDKQLRGLKRYKGFGGSRALPGTTQAADRFVRAAYFLKNLPEPKNSREAVAEVLSVMRNVAQPFAPINLRALKTGEPHTSPTRWRTVADLSQGLYFYENSLNPGILWVKLSEMDFSENAPIKRFALSEDLEKVGDISKLFTPAAMFSFMKPAL